MQECCPREDPIDKAAYLFILHPQESLGKAVLAAAMEVDSWQGGSFTPAYHLLEPASVYFPVDFQLVRLWRAVLEGWVSCGGFFSPGHPALLLPIPLPHGSSCILLYFLELLTARLRFFCKPGQVSQVCREIFILSMSAWSVNIAHICLLKYKIIVKIPILARLQLVPAGSCCPPTAATTDLAPLHSMKEAVLA